MFLNLVNLVCLTCVLMTIFDVKMVAGRTLKEQISAVQSEIRNQEIKLIVDCVYNVTMTYAGGRNLVFVSEQIKTDLSEILVRELDQGLKIISSVSNVSQNIGFFLFFHNEKDVTYTEILEKIPPNSVMRFVIVFDYQERIDLRQIQKVLEEFWLHQIIDVISLVPYKISKNIRVYSYYPFSASRCSETGPPILINVWNSQNKAFLNRHNLFSRTKKVFNLHGCPLSCVGIHRPPESTIIHLSDNTWHLSGTGNKVFRFVQQHMNFTAKISLYQKRNQQNKNRINSSNSPFDLAFGKFIRILDTAPDVDFITENRMDCFTWAVPHGIGRQPSIWTNYTIEFSAILWLIILTNIILVSVLIRWMVHRLKINEVDLRTYNFILFWTFSTFIGATVKLKSNSSPLRLFASQWLLYSLVITASYQAYLGSLMTIPRTEPEINRQIDLLNTSLNLVGRQEMFHLLNESATSSNEFQKLIERFFVLPPIDFDTIMKRVINQRDLAIFTSKREFIYYAQRMRRNLNEQRKVHIFSNCIIKSYFSAFMLRKGSPFQYPIHSILMRLFETGIYNNWNTDNERDEMYHNIIFTKETILIVRELYGAFTVLFGGLILSTFIFFMEMFVKLFKDKQKLK